MKRFRYSLETLLALRREREDERQIRLSLAAGELKSLDDRIAEARMRGEEVFLAGGTTLMELEARERIWMKSRNDVESLVLPRRESQARVDQARLSYIDAHRDRLALDRLREKRLADWKRTVKNEEIKHLDETAKGSTVRRRLMEGDE